WYFFLESGLRVGSAFVAGQPMGSLPVALVLAAIFAIRDRSRANRQLQTTGAGLVPPDARDQVEEMGDVLEVVSLLPKPH
ncbi:hypothetical protein NL530_28655, partial [Klebsiella pneumoniae]|nr:hypothetical protein [Klebsiella pneumoniae]